MGHPEQRRGPTSTLELEEGLWTQRLMQSQAKGSVSSRHSQKDRGGEAKEGDAQRPRPGAETDQLCPKLYSSPPRLDYTAHLPALRWDHVIELWPVACAQKGMSRLPGPLKPLTTPSIHKTTRRPPSPSACWMSTPRSTLDTHVVDGRASTAGL